MAVAEMALEIKEAMKELALQNKQDLTIRIGVHTGTVVAGVIGKKKFIYDVWGDTVNLASRMESLGQPGKIQVTEAVAQKLGNAYKFED